MRAWNAGLRAGRAGLLALGMAGLGGAAARAEAPTPKRDVAEGKELFAREWMAGDPRSHGGDGLGPVYNDTSCVACHNLGAPGGGGPTSKNADIISAFANRGAVTIEAPAEPSYLEKAIAPLVGPDEPTPPRSPAPKPLPPRTDELIKLHAGFRTARSLVLHRFGTDPGYESWRLQMSGLNGFVNSMDVDHPGAAGNRALAELEQVKGQIRFPGPTAIQGRSTQAGEFTVTRSQRNPTALFGSGLIDAIPNAVLEAAAEVKFLEFPEVKGRVGHLKGGKVGRFGWKAQTSSLDDFVRTACAVELGLETPDHHQAGLPQAPDRKATGLDLTDAECASLVSYVRSLPAPAVRAAAGPKEAEVLAAGRASFENVGCATCHTPKLGAVEGIYSDLLLHDLGPDLGDVGQYGVFDPNSTAPEVIDPEGPLAADGPAPAVDEKGQPLEPKPPAFGASRLEWRTPPLWGVRDSGPYLHDGRAENLDQAIALHGGQGATSARKYFELSLGDRQKLQSFLKSLVAPTELARAEK